MGPGVYGFKIYINNDMTDDKNKISLHKCVY
jgi:hypothetical protein